MSVKTTGAEFKRFYNDSAFWPGESWHEDECVTVNGEDWSDDHDYNVIPDDATVRVEGGVVLGLGGSEPSLEGHFKRWRKQHSVASFLVECDGARVEEVKAAIRAAGGRVSK